MGCHYNDERNRGADYGANHRVDCVADVVRNIAKAQREVAGIGENGCLTGCERSINDLLSPGGHHRPSRYDTIPFMLFHQNGCSPFVGSGVVRGGSRSDHHSHFHCIESPIFRVKGFSNRRQNCAILELLVPTEGHTRPSQESDLPETMHKCSCCNQSVCQFFPRTISGHFRATGVCITIDLDCFCGISCLDPIRLRHR